MIGLALTPEQFKTLLRMAYIANWVANGRRDDEGSFLSAYADLEEYIFSRAAEAGFQDVAYKHKIGSGPDHYHPSRAFEYDKEIDRVITDYDNETFLDLLAERFAARAMKAKFGPNAKTKLTPEEYAEELEHFVELYDEEIMEHGLDRLSWNVTTD